MNLQYQWFCINSDVFQYLREGKHYRWALFLPNGRAMAKVAQLVEQEKVSHSLLHTQNWNNFHCSTLFEFCFILQIRPVIEKVYQFNDVPNAFEKIMMKHNRGKTVIDVKDREDLEETDETVAI